MRWDLCWESSYPYGPDELLSPQPLALGPPDALKLAWPLWPLEHAALGVLITPLEENPMHKAPYAAKRA
jgi:hypothetical protein